MSSKLMKTALMASVAFASLTGIAAALLSLMIGRRRTELQSVVS